MLTCVHKNAQIKPGKSDPFRTFELTNYYIKVLYICKIDTNLDLEN